MSPRRPLPAKSAGRTVNFGRDEEYVPVSKLDGVQTAILPGFCARCEQPYRKGEWVFRNGRGELVGVNCCATAKDAGPIPIGLGDLMDSAEEIEGRDFAPLSQVMPSNKTKADMCHSCFQIPAANGLCAC